MTRVDDLAGQLAVRMLTEAAVPVSEASLALVMLEASALAESVTLMEDCLWRARQRIAELVAASGVQNPRLPDFDPESLGLVPSGN
jgi:hypothetical protein